MDSHPQTLHGPPILQPPFSWSEPCTLARIQGGSLCQTSSQSHWCCCCENPHRGHLGHHFSASKVERGATSLLDTSSTETRFTQQPGPSMDPVVLPASCWLVGWSDTVLLLRSRFRWNWLEQQQQRTRSSDPARLPSRLQCPAQGWSELHPSASTIHFHNWGGGGGARQLVGTLQRAGGSRGGMQLCTKMELLSYPVARWDPGLQRAQLAGLVCCCCSCSWSHQLLLNGLQGHGLGSAHIG